MSNNTLVLLIAIAVVVAYFVFVFNSHSGETPRPRVEDDPLKSIQSIDTIGTMNRPIGIGALGNIQARQEAEFREANLRSAQAIHRKNLIVRAEAMGISVEALNAYQITTFSTNEEIRKHRALSVINVRIQKLTDRIKLQTEGLDAKQWIHLSEEVALLEQRLEALSGNRQKAIPESNAPEAGRAHEETEDE